MPFYINEEDREPQAILYILDKNMSILKKCILDFGFISDERSIVSGILNLHFEVLDNDEFLIPIAETSCIYHFTANKR